MESLECRCCPRICAEFYYRRGIKFPSAEGCRLCRRGGHCAPPPVVLCTTPPAKGGGHSDISLFGHTLPCHCEGVRSTLETLAYDCGNPVQYVCGRYARSAFLFTGSPRFARALLAMTMESKCIFLNSLTTPGCAHPSNGGELVPRQDEGKVPLCGGVARSAGVVIVPHPLPLVIPAPGVPANTNVFVGWIRRE